MDLSACTVESLFLLCYHISFPFPPLKKFFKRKWQFGNSLVVHWLGLHASIAGGMGLIPGRGTKILQSAWHGQKKKEKESDNFWCIDYLLKISKLSEFLLKCSLLWKKKIPTIVLVKEKSEWTNLFYFFNMALVLILNCISF